MSATEQKPEGDETTVLRTALVRVLYGSLGRQILAEGRDGALSQILKGADAEFYARHPELKGQPLTPSAPEPLQTEWRVLYRTHSRLAMQQLKLDQHLHDIGA